MICSVPGSYSLVDLVPAVSGYLDWFPPIVSHWGCMDLCPLLSSVITEACYCCTHNLFSVTLLVLFTHNKASSKPAFESILLFLTFKRCNLSLRCPQNVSEISAQNSPGIIYYIILKVAILSGSRNTLFSECTHPKHAHRKRLSHCKY